MLKTIKKSIHYLTKMAKYPRKREIWWVLTNVRSDFRLATLIQLLNRQSCPFQFKNGFCSPSLGLFIEGMHGRKERVYKSIYRWNLKGREIFATDYQLNGLQLEYLSGLFQTIYAYDWKDKTVLDIGGYIGDSALYFFEEGARKVIIYEPVGENIESLNYNVAPYRDQVEVYQMAVSKEDGVFSLSSESRPGEMGFGFRKGDYTITCEGISFRSLLQKHTVDVVKIDCEGGEAHLMDLTSEELLSVPYWIVETHSKELYQMIKDKFCGGGFELVHEFPLAPVVDLLHFKRKEYDA